MAEVSRWQTEQPGFQWTLPCSCLLPMVLSTVVLLAWWATLQVTVWLGQVLLGTVTMLVRE